MTLKTIQSLPLFADASTAEDRASPAAWEVCRRIPTHATFRLETRTKNGRTWGPYWIAHWRGAAGENHGASVGDDADLDLVLESHRVVLVELQARGVFVAHRAPRAAFLSLAAYRAWRIPATTKRATKSTSFRVPLRADDPRSHIGRLSPQAADVDENDQHKKPNGDGARRRSRSTEDAPSMPAVQRNASARRGPHSKRPAGPSAAT